MIQTSEYVSPGHPDKVADGIVSYLLDRYIERDPTVRFAVECQIKDNFVTLGGEITSTATFDDTTVSRYVREAVERIGYTESYAARWGDDNCINPALLTVVAHIGTQSPDIAQGVNRDGWGDQGIFWGMATNNACVDYNPTDHALAKELGQTLYDMARDGRIDIGLDIKTQVTVADGNVRQVIVAAPMRGTQQDIAATTRAVRGTATDICHCDGETEIIVNGTGAYVRHASQGDCGTTGRKLAVDFYGGNCRIGGGTTWGKDPSKADVTLNIYARQKAIEMKRKTDHDTVYCAMSCCIGRKDITMTFFDEHLNQIAYAVESKPAPEIIRSLGLYAPVYFYKNAHGLFELPPDADS